MSTEKSPQLPVLELILENYKNFNARATRDATIAYWRHIERGGKMFWATSWGSESARMVDAGSVATRGFDWLRPTPLPKENPDHLEIVVKDLGSGRQFNLTLSMKSA